MTAANAEIRRAHGVILAVGSFPAGNVTGKGTCGRYAAHMDVPARIESDSSSLAVSWDDGRRDVILAGSLRAACPCAVCQEPDGVERTARVVGGLLAVTIADVALVGDYAVSIGFGPDAHTAGIFPYTLLRSLGDEAA